MSANENNDTQLEEKSFLRAKDGLMSWLITVDHKRIGLMYLVATMFFFLVAGLLAMAMRTELLTPGQDYMSAQTYNQVFTLHGAIMVFLFIIPSIPAAMGNFLLPLMLGTRGSGFANTVLDELRGDATTGAGAGLRRRSISVGTCASAAH